MTLDLTCRVATFSAGAQLPASVRQRLSTRIAEVFSAACGERLSLRVIDSGDNGEYPGTADVVTATELHEFGLALNRNPIYLGVPRSSGPAVHNIAVILANRYEPARHALGVMFDRGFTTQDDLSNTQEYAGVPRESCAIFVDAIDERRGRGRPGGEDFLSELEFTAIHELGHVFNLHHTLEQSFLATSPLSSPYGPAAQHFIPDHLNSLAACDTDHFVWPGGSDFIETDHEGHLNAPRSRSRLLPLGLELQIDVAPREFHFFDPLELDVTLRVASGAHRMFQVPDCLDPGYSQFRIWIEEPDGSRRTLRSPHHYCPSGQQLHISPTTPFRRDIALFGEAGGHTFHRSGVHRVWVEFDVTGRKKIRSNVIELNVLSRRLRTARARVTRSLLIQGAVARLLYHKVDISNGRLLKKLATACEENPRWPCSSPLWYAIGRAHLRQINRQTADRPQSQLVQRCTKALQNAARSEELGVHRLAKTHAILEHLKAHDWDGLREPRARLHESQDFQPRV